MKKIVLSIIALLTLALGTTGITNVFAAQNEKKEDTLEKTEIKKSEERVTNTGVDSLIEDRENNESTVQTLTTNPMFEESVLEPVSLVSNANKTNAESKNTVNYIIKNGDTLVNIAEAFKVEVSDLAEWNESVTQGNSLQIDEIIKIETELDPESISPKKLTWEKEEIKESEAALSETKIETEAIEEMSTSALNDSAEKITVVATAYSRNQPSLTNITAMGIDLSKNSQVIAVDPTVIPLGTKVYVEGYGEAIAGDTGSAIIGNRVDLHMESIDASFAWGIQEVELTIID
ncbi:3D domain-containing protein [Carnobacterium jeotgali]